MRTSARFRLYFLIIALIICVPAFWVMPETLDTPLSLLLCGIYAGLLFVVMPASYAYCVIKKGAQAWWKIILPFSLASLVARYSFPTEIASYFEFITYIRYPLAAILALIELAVVAYVIKSLWQARHLKGDPRIHAAATAEDTTGWQKDMLVTMAYEPASWYYSIPYLSRHHPGALASLRLRSARLWHFALLFTTIVLSSSAAYILIAPFSELTAIVVSSLIAWGLVSVVANYRVSRRFAVYVKDNVLIVNASFFTLYRIPLSQIASIERVSQARDALTEAAIAGRGQPSVALHFVSPVTEYTLMGTISEKVSSLYLSTDEPEQLLALAPVAEEDIRKRA